MIDLFLRNGGFSEVELSSAVRTRRLTIPTANAPVVVDDRDPVRFLPRCLHGTYFDAGRFFALMALHRHVIRSLFRNGWRVVVMIAFFEIEGTIGHLQDTNVLKFRAAGLVVFLHAGMHALSASDATGQIQGIGEFHAVHGFQVFDMRTNSVFTFHFRLNPGQDIFQLIRRQFPIMFLEKSLYRREGVEVFKR